MIQSEDTDVTISTESPAAKPSENAMLTMIATMADTTWRMFLPILGFLIAGIFADKAVGSFPWLTLLGFVLGVALAVILVRSQLKKGTQRN